MYLKVHLLKALRCFQFRYTRLLKGIEPKLKLEHETLNYSNHASNVVQTPLISSVFFLDSGREQIWF